MPELQINELRRVLNQANALLDAAMALAAADEELRGRLKHIRERVRDEQSYLAGLSRLRFPADGRAY